MKNYVDAIALQEYTTKLVAKLKTLFPGTPTAAATVADMTDHSKTYVYVGSESGYTAGDWYYWDGTAWTSGGPFQATSIITDTTLAVAGEAADAKATGDAIAAAKTAVLNAMAPAYSPSGTYEVGKYVNHDGKIYRCITAITTAEAWTAGHWTEVPLGTDLASQVSDLKTQIDDVNSALSEAVTMGQWEDVTLTLGTSGYYDLSGTFHVEANRQNATISVSPGDKFRLDTYLSSTLIPAVEFFNGATFKDYLKAGTGSPEVVEDYEFTVPPDVDTVIVQCPVSTQYHTMSLEKFDATNEFKAYTKTESDSRYYAKADGELVAETAYAMEDDLYTTVESWDNVPLTLGTSGYYDLSGYFHGEANRKNATLSVVPGEKYKLTTLIRSTLIPAVEFFNGATHKSNLKPGTGTNEKLNDYEITVPTDVDTMIVQNADTLVDDELSLKKYNTSEDLQVYTKSETNALLAEMPKKYGVRWDVSDPDDLGERCFDAVGLNATIGVGATAGASDFDSIYPWSEMKRCNIKTNSAGAKIVTFEGETGFALDGTNGDVFVRIPKFYYERYKENGYEYRVVSATGSFVHPAFVEDEKVLDEIFVGAFEGHINNNALVSMAGVIPTSNETSQTFLTAAQNKGDGYSLYDMRCVDAVWTLMAVEYGCRNTNQILGYGYADFLQATNNEFGVVCDTAATYTNVFSASISYSAARIGSMPVGTSIVICKGDQLNCITFAKLTGVTSDANHWYLAFDGDPVDLDTTCFIGSAGCITNFCSTVPSGALSWHTGRANWQSGSNTKNPVRYRWIENIIGSIWHFLPDITFHDLQMYQCRNIKDYVMHKHTDPYLPVGNVYEENMDNGDKRDITGWNYWITELDNDIFAKGVDFARAYDKSLTSTKAFGAYYYMAAYTACIANGGGFDHLYRCNVLTQRAWVAENAKWYLYGARLIYKNVM